MIRPAIVLALLLLSAVMMRGVASDWRKGMPTPSDSAAKKATAAGEAVALPQVKPLQPVVPGVLPDLKDGYLFNPERMLASDVPPPAQPVEEKVEESPKNTTGIAASIGDVTFTGSIIADNFSRAIIVYKEKEADKSKTPAQPASRSSKAKAPKAPAAAATGGEKHAQLEVGDVLDGYKVAEIQPDKLVFTKDDETVEKLLYDPEKKRQAPPPRAGGGPPGGGPPPPRPAGIQSTTIGGDASSAPPAPPAPGGVKPPTPPVPGSVNPAIPPAPVASPTIKTPTSPTTPSATDNSSPTSPVRRMVISRQPAGRPDTSRVIRKSQTTDDMMGSPPPPGVDGAPPPDPNATPPMPVGN